MTCSGWKPYQLERHVFFEQGESPRVAMASAETREQLEYYLDFIQALRQYVYGRKSERNPFKIAEYKHRLRVLPDLDQFLKDKIAWYDAGSEVRRWKEGVDPNTARARTLRLSRRLEGN